MAGANGECQNRAVLDQWHPLGAIDDDSSIGHIRRFVQTIFAQDLPIIENQNPKRLPLDPQAETPIRSDRASILYRRWLSDLGATYAVIPAA